MTPLAIEDSFSVTLECKEHHLIESNFLGAVNDSFCLILIPSWCTIVQITIEKTVLQQNYSCYELQGEYVLPGTRDRNPVDKEGGLIKRLMSGHIGNAISSMGRWRMKLEVRRAEVAEMLPLARLLSRSMDPAVRSRSKPTFYNPPLAPYNKSPHPNALLSGWKDFFMQSLQSVGLYTESLQQLLETVRGLHAPSNDVVLDDLSLPGLSELKGHWHGSLDASGGGNGDTLAEFDFHGEDWEWGDYKTQHVLAVGAYSNDDGMHLERIFIQKDNATIHADGTLLGPKTNLHFAVLNFPVSLVPTVVQIIESTAMDVVHSLRQLLAPIKGILHMEGDLRGSLAKPECDVQVRLLDGSIGGVDLGRAEVVASLTSTSRFLFNAKFEPITQNGHVLIQGSIPVAFVQNNTLQEDVELDKSQVTWVPDWVKEKNRGTVDDASDKKVSRDRNEEGWNTQLAESLKGLNWQILDVGEVRIDADIKDGGMTLVTALSPHANWLHGNADLKLEVRGTVDQPVLNGHASFHRASISSPVLRKPLTNFGGNVHVQSNRLCITSLESRVSRKGKLLVKGNLPLRTSEAAPDDKIELKCEVLEVRAQKVLSGQVDSQLQITGSILQPNISGNIKISQGEAYLPHERGGTPASNRFPSNQAVLPTAGVSRMFASRYVSRFLNSEFASLREKVSQSFGSGSVWACFTVFHVLYQPSFSIHYRNGTHQCPSHTHLCATFFPGEQYPRPLLGLFGSQFTALLSVCFNDLSRTPCRPQSQPTLHIATMAPRRALFQRERFTHMARDASPVSITLELPPFVATTGLRWLPSRMEMALPEPTRHDVKRQHTARHWGQHNGLNSLISYAEVVARDKHTGGQAKGIVNENHNLASSGDDVKQRSQASRNTSKLRRPSLEFGNGNNEAGLAELPID
ncbi:hypothetical protein JHK85_040414 [Glycine max]|nr:hypothetical protein JHK85_040414 [Glycine max]